MKDDETLAQFIETLCTTCRACANLISLVAETEECKKCANSRKRPLVPTATPPSSPVLAEKRGRQSKSATPTPTSPAEKPPVIKQEAGVKTQATATKALLNATKEALNHNNNNNNNNNSNINNGSSAKPTIKTEPNGVTPTVASSGPAQPQSQAQALRQVRFQHHNNSTSSNNGTSNQDANSSNLDLSASNNTSSSSSSSSSSSTSSSSLAGGTANTSTIGKYLAPLVAEVHPEQMTAKSQSSYYKSPTTLSSSASFPSSVSTPFTASQSACPAAPAASAAKAATAPVAAAASTSYASTAITSPRHATPTSASCSHLRSQPIDWSIEEVIQYIESNDNSLAVHGDLFRKHVSICNVSSQIFTLLMRISLRIGRKSMGKLYCYLTQK